MLTVGSDVVNISRVAGLLEKYGVKFAKRVLGEGEYADFSRSLRPATFLASRIAAKEACAKALGSGIARNVSWRDIQVLKSKGSPPTPVLSGGAAAYLVDISPPGKKLRLTLSISHDEPSAFAVAALVAEPNGL